VQPRPDWYFIWYYAALALVPYNIENYVIIGAPVIFLGIMFALPFIANGGERAPSRRPWAIASVVLGALMIASLIETGDLAPWSPRFETASLPLPAKITTGLSGPALQGAKLWRTYGCPYCHMISGYGGIRGPDLTNIGNELTPDQITIRIANGGYNMPQYGGLMPPDQLNDLVAFLQTRREYAVANSASRQKLSGGAGGRGP
jgi:ubiquinol-cytochrome c reductase cytochrome b subunit